MTQTQAPPQSIGAWSFTLPSPLKFGTYDLFPNPVGVPYGFLSVTWETGRVDTYVNVPQPVATAFWVSSNPWQFFQNQIQRVYPQALLTSPSNVTLTLGQGGVLTI